MFDRSKAGRTYFDIRCLGTVALDTQEMTAESLQALSGCLLVADVLILDLEGWPSGRRRQS